MVNRTAVMPIIQYNNVFNNYFGSYTNFAPDATNISVPLVYENGANANFHLQPNSGWINTGNPAKNDANDCTRSDMGAYGGQWGNW